MITISKAKPYFGYVPKIPLANIENNDSFVSGGTMKTK
jgi:hypothetical protein